MISCLAMEAQSRPQVRPAGSGDPGLEASLTSSSHEASRASASRMYMQKRFRLHRTCRKDIAASQREPQGVPDLLQLLTRWLFIECALASNVEKRLR